MKKLLLLAVFLLASAATYAGGYRVSLQGNKSLAMGHTGVAVVNSSELVFFNPAGLVYLEQKLSISVGAHGVISNVAFQSAETGATARTDSPIGTPFYAYASYKATDWLAFGLGVYTPYGSTVEYPDDWAGSHLVNNIELQAIYAQLSAAVKVNDKLSLSAGFIYVNGGVNFNRNLSRTLTDIDGNRSEVTLDATGVTETGWTVSGMFNVTEDFRLGATYRSKIDINAEGGSAVFENIPNSPATPFPAETEFDATLPLPAEMTIGLSYRFCEKWLFAFDLNTAYWGVYESLDIDFADENVPDSQNVRNYENASTYRFGLQYDAHKNFTLRAGYYFDETPVQNGFFAPETPRNDSSGYTAGLSYRIGERFSLDASFLYLQFKEVNASYDFYVDPGAETTNSFGGTYKSNAFIPGLGITYNL